MSEINEAVDRQVVSQTLLLCYIGILAVSEINEAVDRQVVSQTLLLLCYIGILAVSEINEAVDRQVVSQTLSALQSSAASLSNVDASNAEHYQQLLSRVKSEKAQVVHYVIIYIWIL